MIKLFIVLALSTLTTVACSKIESAHAEETSARNEIKVISVDEAALLVKDKTVVVLDIRSPEEFSEGHIEGALNINYHEDDFETQIAKLDRDTKYILHCHSGGRSGNTEKLLESLGFNNVNHLKSGISGWRKAGLPQVKP